MAAISELATLTIRLNDGSELTFGEIEILSKRTKDELEGIVREKIRITEPIYT